MYYFLSRRLRSYTNGSLTYAYYRNYLQLLAERDHISSLVQTFIRPATLTKHDRTPIARASSTPEDVLLPLAQEALLHPVRALLVRLNGE